jgi:hypothetical protein
MEETEAIITCIRRFSTFRLGETWDLRKIPATPGVLADPDV